MATKIEQRFDKRCWVCGRTREDIIKDLKLDPSVLRGDSLPFHEFQYRVIHDLEGNRLVEDFDDIYVRKKNGGRKFVPLKEVTDVKMTYTICPLCENLFTLHRS